MKPILYTTTLLLGLGVLASCTSEVSMGKQESPKQIQIIDTDEDGIPDETDNCLTIANPDQADTNGDDVGDVCEDLECELNRCAEANQGSGSICDGDTRIECLVDVDMCVVEDQELVCTNGCEMGECTALEECSSNFCNDRGFSSGLHCDGEDSVRCGSDAEGCLLEEDRTFCENGCQTSGASVGQCDPGEIDPNAPYPASAAIGGVSFDWSSHERRAPGSDNFPVTWGADGHQYTSWGDGGGFGGTNSNGRVSLGVARVEGTASSYTGTNLNGGVNPESGNRSLSGKSYGILSLVGDLYMWRSPGSGFTNWDHVDLYKSIDNGHTWTTVIPSFVTESDGVGIPTILQFGQDYAGSRDQYVYSYFIDIQDGSSLSVQAPGRVSLVRAPASQIDEPAAYEWFAGLDGLSQATWTSSVQNRAPVFEDSRGVGWNLSVIYNPGLGRYLLATEHSETMVGNLGIFDAPEPWGPWTTVSYEDNWPSGGQVQHSSFFWNFSPKWWSNGGRDFVLVFTGISENDSWNTVWGSFTMP